MSDTEKRKPGTGQPGQAERAAEVDEMIRRAQDPNDPYDGGDDEGKGTNR